MLRTHSKCLSVQDSNEVFVEVAPRPTDWASILFKYRRILGQCRSILRECGVAGWTEREVGYFMLGSQNGRITENRHRPTPSRHHSSSDGAT